MVRDPARLPQPPKQPIHRRMIFGRLGLHSLLVLLAITLALASPLTALAQVEPPRSLRIVPTVLPDLEPEDVGDEGEVGVAGIIEMIIDTDPGVDDAAALIWLFSQTRANLHVRGIVTVAGNTDVVNATNNVQLILGSDWLNVTDNIPVVSGAAGPANQILSKTGQAIHGPDGLWFFGSQQEQPIPTDYESSATQFYCGDNATPPSIGSGVTVLALGPLTNIAAAIDTCPRRWNGVRIVTLGGAKYGGNQTPVSEYNYWQDPEAAAIVFSNALRVGYTLDQVPEDAFDQFAMDFDDAKELYKSPNAAMAHLLVPLSFYFCSLSQQCVFDNNTSLPITDKHGVPIFFKMDEYGYPVLDKKGNPIPVPNGQVQFPPIADPVAAIYALNPSLGTPQSALVKILANDPAIQYRLPAYVRGQSIIGLSNTERLSMIATDQQLNILAELSVAGDFDGLFSAITRLLSSDLDNATVVTDIAARIMINRFLRYVANSDGESDRASIDVVGDPAPTGSEQLLLPMVSDN